MKGEVILVTGANGGVGTAVVQHLLELGATVAGA
jgi:NAD(P)-dependent dehydrogenase (short-subunit alcohol dehydrogenase family)